MKTTMKKLKKELLRFVENDNFKDLFVEKTHKLVTNTDERGILEITLKTLKEKDHPFDPDRFDFEQVGNYDGKWYYKGTKKEASEKHLHSWLGEFEYKDLSSDESDKHWNTNTVFRVWLSENKEDIMIQVNGTYELYDRHSEFYHAPFEDRLNKFLTASGFTWDHFDTAHISVEV